MVFDPTQAYESGLIGCKDDPEAERKFDIYIRALGGDPIGQDVAYEWGLNDLGKGKLTAPWLVVEKVFPGCWPGAAQQVGDCFPAGTMVSMADGSKRPVEQVRIGESVLSHAGVPRVVTDTIRKPFSGDLVKIRAKGSPHYVSATPDHRFVTVNDTAHWCPVELLGKGDLVSLPRHDAVGTNATYDLADCPSSVAPGNEGRRIPASSAERLRWHGGWGEVNRYIRMDERLGWLVGLYLAEGSCDVDRGGRPYRITLNLNKNETLIAETAAAYIEDVFGVKATICQVPSKPSVLYVRVTCAPLVWLFKRLAPGNTYTKRICRSLMLQPKAVRLAVLRGWFAGDGSLNSKRRAGRKDSRWSHFRAAGVSVSGGLVEDMFDLANSCHLVASVCFRKPRNASKAASNLLLNGANAAAVFPARINECRIDLSRSKSAAEHGMLKPVDSVERVPFTGDVFCLEVADDHSFIANGYAVHNCVSHGCKNAGLLTVACEIYSSKPDEVTGRIEGAPEIPEAGIKDGAFSTEAIYYWRGHSGLHGWNCADAARQVTTNAGMWPRKPYPEVNLDLTRYSSSNIKWGGSPPPEEVARIGREHLIRTATRLSGREQVRDFLAAGYGVFNCSGLGFSKTRDEFGVSRQSGSWSHSQSWIGFDDRPETHEKYGQALVCWLNSWGKFNSGPRKVRGTDYEIPEGAFWALAETIDACSCFALSSAAGWPRKRLPDYGAIGNI